MKQVIYFNAILLLNSQLEPGCKIIKNSSSPLFCTSWPAGPEDWKTVLIPCQGDVENGLSKHAQFFLFLLLNYVSWRISNLNPHFFVDCIPYYRGNLLLFFPNAFHLSGKAIQIAIFPSSAETNTLNSAQSYVQPSEFPELFWKLLLNIWVWHKGKIIKLSLIKKDTYP